MMSRATLWADAERETGTNWSPTPEVICGVANGNPVLSNGTSRKNMFGMQQCNLFSAPRNNSHALSRINDWEARILNKAAQLGPVNIEQIKAYTNTYLDDNEMAEFKTCLADLQK